jgi:microcystin-dependent protein
MCCYLQELPVHNKTKFLRKSVGSTTSSGGGTWSQISRSAVGLGSTVSAANPSTTLSKETLSAVGGTGVSCEVPAQEPPSGCFACCIR